MERFLVAFLLLIFVAIGHASQESFCCPGGQPVLYKKPGVYSCWDPRTNETWPITLKCDNLIHLSQDDGPHLFVDENGDLILQMKNREDTYVRNNFCVAQLRSRRNKTKNTGIAVICYEEEFNYISQDTYGYLMATSAIFLVVTAGIYITRDDRRELLGKCIISFCASLATALGLTSVIKLVPYSDMNLCAVRGFLAYFFFMASFFWMNGIAIQIGLIIMRRDLGTKIYGWGKYLRYALYAWGVPAMLTSVMAVINFIPGDHLKPGIGLNRCWFFDMKQQWQYMYSIMAVLVVFNIGIFLYTLAQIWHNSFSCGTVKSKFLLTIQMFVITGIPWVLEMVSSLVKSNLAWEIVDVVISLQGLLVFLVLVAFPRSAPTPAISENRYFTPPSSQLVYNIAIDQPYCKMVEEKY